MRNAETVQEYCGYFEEKLREISAISQPFFQSHARLILEDSATCSLERSCRKSYSV